MRTDTKAHTPTHTDIIMQEYKVIHDKLKMKEKEELDETIPLFRKQICWCPAVSLYRSS
jgi:hypothetical protein